MKEQRKKRKKDAVSQGTAAAVQEREQRAKVVAVSVLCCQKKVGIMLLQFPVVLLRGGRRLFPSPSFFSSSFSFPVLSTQNKNGEPNQIQVELWRPNQAPQRRPPALLLLRWWQTGNHKMLHVRGDDLGTLGVSFSVNLGDFWVTQGDSSSYETEMRHDGNGTAAWRCRLLPLTWGFETMAWNPSSSFLISITKKMMMLL
ncbi:hypothetical protein PIB30_006067 [Stylosanthes scabra]|uniref:Uncharacterized protein n=1 Tax=Stylosanthes scabra TaxID=79078 RepID=A0ABU6V4F6_9FABA|nr:hypothetical protein [Stylosanthes scabra]